MSLLWVMAPKCQSDLSGDTFPRQVLYGKGVAMCAFLMVVSKRCFQIPHLS